jgi:hypothetical protein
MMTIRVFRYLEELDAFLVTEEFSQLADHLGLTEWHPVVWIGRLFRLDNDVGEHWFDNWDERSLLEEKAKELGIDPSNLMVIVPERMADGRDGPCHPPSLRKAFWRDVLMSLELSYELLFEEARYNNLRMKDLLPEDYIVDLEVRIAKIKTEQSGYQG